MDLRDTVDLMLSEHHENRFLAEYRQTRIRAERLHNIIVKLRSGTLDFKAKCDVYLLERQEEVMREYLKILEIRAEQEGIDVAYLT